MARFIDKMMDMMKLNDYDEDETQVDESSRATEAVTNHYNMESRYKQKSNDIKEDQTRQFTSYTGGKQPATQSKIVNFQASVKMEVIVIQPETYDEAQDICDHIKSQRPVIINLEHMEHNIAQRIMDFISGSCYTLNGNLQRVTNNIFIIAPENVDIAGDFREELKSNGIILPWKSQDEE